MRTDFDSYVIVDWSANASPKTGADSIWWAALGWAEGELKLERLENPSTRQEAEESIERFLKGAVAAGRSVLVGFDFPYGYPAGFARLLGLDGPPWRAAWDLLAREIRDEQTTRKANNRFEVAARLNERIGGKLFWGHPHGRVYAGLAPTKPPPHGRVAEFRITERMARGAKSGWQLSGAGAVGSQVLMGLPTLHRLRTEPELASLSTVWPFETGPSLPSRREGRGRIVHAEIYPSLIRAKPAPGQVKDEAQVLALGRWLAQLDASNELPAHFAAPSLLSAAELAQVLDEEGWILGVRP